MDIRPGTKEFDFLKRNLREIHHVVPEAPGFKTPQLCSYCNPRNYFWVAVATVVLGCITILMGAYAYTHPGVDDVGLTVGPFAVIVGVIFLIFGFVSFYRHMTTSEVKEQKLCAEISSLIATQRNKALATKMDRTPGARALYIRENQKQLREDEIYIRHSHEYIFSNPHGVEFYRKLAGDEVITMWEEPYRRLLQFKQVPWKTENEEDAEPSWKKESDAYEKMLTKEGMTLFEMRQAHDRFVNFLMKERNVSKDQAEDVAAEAETKIKFKGPRL